MALLRPDTSVVDPRFLLYLYLSPAFQLIIERNTIHGATVNRISLNTMGDWKVSLPEMREQHKLAQVLGALDEKIHISYSIAQTATDLRDTLLPHLMSGRLRVKDAEKQVEAVV